MEETLQQEREESENINQNEEQGGIRRRLRDRDLLRKRKAEAEEKETNQWVLGVESQRKRPRVVSGTKRRGRPKKSELTPERPIIQEEATGPQEAPAVVVVPEPAEVIQVQAPGSLLAVESQPSSSFAPPDPLPVFGDIQNPVFGPSPTHPTPVIPTPALFSPSPPAPAPSKIPDMAPIPVQDLTPVPEAVPVPVPAPVIILDPFPAAQESQVREAIDQIHVEDVGPDEETDIPSSQDKIAEEDLIEPVSINVPEQNEMFSIPTLSSTPPPQKYFPGNAF